MSFNTQLWEKVALKNFIKDQNDFLNTVSGSIDVSDNEAVIVPIFDISGDGISEDGKTNWITPEKSFKKIETDKELRLAIRNTRMDELSTNVALQKNSAILAGKRMRERFAKNIRKQLFFDAENKLTYKEANNGKETTELSHAMFLSASEVFSKADIPENEKIAVFPPSLRAQLINLVDNKGNRIFIPVSNQGEKAIFSGQIGEVDGWKILIESCPLLSSAGNVVSSADKKAGCFYHFSSLVYGAEKKIFVKEGFNRDESAHEILLSLKYGVKGVFPKRIITIRED